MDRNKIIDIPNHIVGQKMKNGTPEKIFFPVKKETEFNAKVIQQSMDRSDITTGCHSKSYFELSLKYVEIHQKNAIEIRALTIPSKAFFFMSMFLSFISLKQEKITRDAMAAINIQVNIADSTKLIVKSAEQILRGTRVSVKARKINQVFFKFNFNFNTSNKTYF